LTPAHASLSTSSASCFTSTLSRVGAGYSAIFGAISAVKLINFRPNGRKFSRKAATSSPAILLPFSGLFSSLREENHARWFHRKNFSLKLSTATPLTENNKSFKIDPVVGS